MRIKNRSVLFWAMLVISLVCSLVLLFGRVTAEHRDRQVACAVSYEEVLKLAAAGGHDAAQWLEYFSQWGVHYLVITDENEVEGTAAAEKVGMETGRSGDTAKSGDAFLLPYMVRSRNIDPYEKPLGDSSVPLALVENYTRTGVIMPEDFDADAWDGPMVKTLNMFDAYSMHYVMDEPSTENENIVFRAVAERSMRLVILTTLEHEGGGIVTEPDAYEDLLTGLSQRLEERGFVLGDEFSCLETKPLSPVLLAGASILAVVMLVLLLCLVLPVKPLWENLLLCFGALCAIGGALVMPEIMQKLIAFGGAVLAGCYGVLLLGRIAVSGYVCLPLGKVVLRYMLCLALVLCVGMAGGLYVGAVLASRAYMLQFKVFSGVKLAQFIPMAAALVWLGIKLYGKKSPLQGEKRKKVPAALIIVLCIGVAAVVAVMLLRSGDNMLPVSELEVKARNWLEMTLYVRPRTKEMLIAFPVLALFVVSCDRRIRLFQLALGVLSSIGVVSVINTFCHIFTPVRMSVARTLLGAGIGLVIGLAALMVFRLLLGKEKEE